MFQITNAAIATVGIQCLVIGTLRTKLNIELIGRCTGIDTPSIGIYLFLINIILSNGFCQSQAIHTDNGCIQQISFREFTQDIENATGTVHILYVILLSIWSHLAKTRYTAGKHIDIVHGKIHFRFMGNGQQMKYSIGRTTHRNIQCHGIEESFASCDTFRQYAFISFFIIFIGILHDEGSSILEQLCTVGVSSKDGTIARQSQTDCFIQAIHGIGGKHTRTTSTSWTSMVFNLSYLLITYRCIRTLNHGINQVQMLVVPFASFHRTTRNKYSRDIQSHSSHQHTRRNLVAITDTYHRICLVGIYHIFHTVGNDVTAWQGIKHTIVSHSDTIIHCNGIELGSKTTELFNFCLYLLTNFMQMSMPRNELSK